MQGRKNVQDLIGQKFGRLKVVSRVNSQGRASPRKAYWACLCDCGSMVVIVGCSLTGGTTRSCGCYKSDVTRRRMTNPMITDEERKLGRNRTLMLGHKEWRRSVYERDGYICRVCGYDKGGILVAHHKDAWGWCKERRLDEDNGATCCEDCHKEFHDIYGWGGNTEAQWEEFVDSKRLKEMVA